MKKYFFILVIMTLTFNASAQKRLIIYNFSSYDVSVSDNITKHTTNAYPNVTDYVTDILIPSGGGSLELYTGHATRFPFNALDSSPALIIPTWAVQTSATNYTSTPNNANGVTLAYGANQIFHCIKYDDSFESGILGTSPLGSNEVVLTQTTGLYDEFISGTDIEYTLVIVDN